MIKLTKNSSEFDKVKFVTRAVGGRFNIIEMKGMKLTGSDGRSLHQAVCYDIPEGVYNVVKNTKTMVWLEENKDVSYPDTDAVFPTGDVEKTLEAWPQNGNGRCSICQEYTKIIRALDESMTINYKYFAQLEGENYQVKIFDSKKPVLFEGDGIKALIMPVWMR